MKQTLLVALLALSVMSSAQVNKPTFNADGTVSKVAGVGLVQKLGADVPLDLTFKDENGADVRLSQFFGHRPVILSLIFYQCHTGCSLEVSGLEDTFTKMSFVAPGKAAGTAHAILGQDVDIVSISIDPNEGAADATMKRKTVLDALKDSKAEPGAAAGWHFLTGNLENLNRLAVAVGYSYTYNPTTKAISHPTGLVLLSPSGKITQYFYGVTYDSRPLHDAIALASTNTVGPKAQVLLFGCLSHDLLTGKYSVNIERATQVLGCLTVLILGISIWRMGHSKKMVTHG